MGCWQHGQQAGFTQGKFLPRRAISLTSAATRSTNRVTPAGRSSPCTEGAVGLDKGPPPYLNSIMISVSI